MAGDYDGDKATVIFEDTIVDKFRSAPLHLSVPPDDIEEGFEEKLDTVKDFLQKIEPMSENAKIRTFQGYALSSVRETSVVGMYSNFHLISTYVNGYRHRETIRLAHMYVEGVHMLSCQLADIFMITQGSVWRLTGVKRAWQSALTS